MTHKQRKRWLSSIIYHHHFKFRHELGEKDLGLHKESTISGHYWLFHWLNLKSDQKSHNRVQNDIEKNSFLHAWISKIVVFQHCNIAVTMHNLADFELLDQLNNIAPSVLLTKNVSGNLRNMCYGLPPQTFQPWIFQPRPPNNGVKRLVVE